MLLLLISFSLGAVGCRSTDTRPTGGAAQTQGKPTPNTNPFPTGQPIIGTPKIAQENDSTDVSGVLAGQIIDTNNRRPNRAYIQVLPTTELTNGKPAKAPLEVQADENGNFVISGLKPGQSYKLLARWKDGETMLAGQVEAVPPNSLLMIKISERFAGPSTPPIPSPPQVPGAPKATGPTNPTPTPTPTPTPVRPPSDPLLGPGGSSSQGEPGGSGLPTPGAGTLNGASEPSLPKPTLPVRPESIGRDNPGPPRLGVPATIPPGPGPNRPAPPASLPGPAGAGVIQPPRVPFCDPIQNERVANFGLFDLSGEPWEFRQSPGKLVLLDFWGTFCVPCVRAIPKLVDLQRRYGPDLQIVGITVARTNRADRVSGVERLARDLRINYRLVLADDEHRCPVLRGFGVTQYPTLILLRGDGQILHRIVGTEGIAELEGIIQRELGR